MGNTPCLIGKRSKARDVSFTFTLTFHAKTYLAELQKVHVHFSSFSTGTGKYTQREQKFGFAIENLSANLPVKVFINSPPQQKSTGELHDSGDNEYCCGSGAGDGYFTEHSCCREELGKSC
jgi:hypothetical protein